MRLPWFPPLLRATIELKSLSAWTFSIVPKSPPFVSRIRGRGEEDAFFHKIYPLQVLMRQILAYISHAFCGKPQRWSGSQNWRSGRRSCHERKGRRGRGEARDGRNRDLHRGERFRVPYEILSRSSATSATFPKASSSMYVFDITEKGGTGKKICEDGSVPDIPMKAATLKPSRTLTLRSMSDFGLSPVGSTQYRRLNLSAAVRQQNNSLAADRLLE